VAQPGAGPGEFTAPSDNSEEKDKCAKPFNNLCGKAGENSYLEESLCGFFQRLGNLFSTETALVSF
jgi:hypothetical protein